MASRNMKILLFVVALSGISVICLAYNFSVYNPNAYVVRISGLVYEEVEISYDDLIDPSGPYTVVEDQQYDVMNKLNYNYTYTYSGVTLASILNLAVDLKPGATKFQFISTDNYRSDPFDISLALANPEEVILIFEEDGVALLPKEQNGLGPFRGMINLTLTLPDYNSKYWVKWVNGIIIS